MTCTNVGEEPVLRDNHSQKESERMHVIIITGPCGAGKTSTMWKLGELLASRDISRAVIDVDEVRNFHPAPEDDPFNSRLAMQNVAAMAENFRRAGARCLIFAEVVEHPELAIGYGELIPESDVHVVRLDVPMDLLLARLEARESVETIDWYRNRARELPAIMERRRIGDLVIDVGERSTEDVAAEIADHLGYRAVPG
jgi:ribose 1,5-bisphosphokinase PhnN